MPIDALGSSAHQLAATLCALGTTPLGALLSDRAHSVMRRLDPELTETLVEELDETVADKAARAVREPGGGAPTVANDSCGGAGSLTRLTHCAGASLRLHSTTLTFTTRRSYLRIDRLN